MMINPPDPVFHDAPKVFHAVYVYPVPGRILICLMFDRYMNIFIFIFLYLSIIPLTKPR
jgi:hypothetical protein